MSRTTRHRKLDLRIPILVAALLAPAAAQAYSGLGCTNLPDYDRAVGALQGMPSACDMTIAEARRIVAAHDGANAGVPTAVGPHRSRRVPAAEE